VKTGVKTALPVRASAGRVSWSEALHAKHVAIPAEHGAWIFLFSPLAIGLAAGGMGRASFWLVTAALAAFLIRQPVTMMVKAYSGRRPKSELRSALLWLSVYGLVGLIASVKLAVLGYGFVFALALPALPVFAWHLWLVSRRAERRQVMVEVAAGGMLALAAPAALWVGLGQYNPSGWYLWALCWLQVSGTILYAYLRLQQRSLKAMPTRFESYRMGKTALVFNLSAFLLVALLSAARLIPSWVFLAYLIQPIEVVYGIFRPAVGVKPKSIGIRQLIISTLFTLLFILTWSL
jgi:hypothetical protein